jgi:hypothetical protein
MKKPAAFRPNALEAKFLAETRSRIAAIRNINASRKSFDRPPLERSESPDGYLLLQRTSPTGFFSAGIWLRGAKRKPKVKVEPTIAEVKASMVALKRRRAAENDSARRARLAKMETRCQLDRTEAILAEGRALFHSIFQLKNELPFERERRLRAKRNTRR